MPDSIVRLRFDVVRRNLGRWMTKLKRAFHALEKQQQRITRLERQLSQLQQG